MGVIHIIEVSLPEPFPRSSTWDPRKHTERIELITFFLLVALVRHSLFQVTGPRALCRHPGLRLVWWAGSISGESRVRPLGPWTLKDVQAAQAPRLWLNCILSIPMAGLVRGPPLADPPRSL